MSGIINYTEDGVIKFPGKLRYIEEMAIAQHFLLHPSPYIVPIKAVCHSRGYYLMHTGKDANLKSFGLSDWLENLWLYLKKKGWSHNDVHCGQKTGGKSNIVIIQDHFRLIDLEALYLQDGPTFQCWAQIDFLLQVIARNIRPTSDSCLHA